MLGGGLNANLVRHTFALPILRKQNPLVSRRPERRAIVDFSEVPGDLPLIIACARCLKDVVPLKLAEDMVFGERAGRWIGYALGTLHHHVRHGRKLDGADQSQGCHFGVAKSQLLSS